MSLHGVLIDEGHIDGGFFGGNLNFDPLDDGILFAMSLQSSLLYSLLLGFDPGFSFSFLPQNVGHTSRVVEFEHATSLSF